MPVPVSRRPTRAPSSLGHADCAASGARPPTAAASCAQQHRNPASAPDAQLWDGRTVSRPAAHSAVNAPPSEKENFAPALSNPLYDRYADDGTPIPFSAGRPTGTWPHHPGDKLAAARRSGTTDVSSLKTGKSPSGLNGLPHAQWSHSTSHNGVAVGAVSKRRGHSGSTAVTSPSRQGRAKFSKEEAEEVLLGYDGHSSSYPQAASVGHLYYAGDSDDSLDYAASCGKHVRGTKLAFRSYIDLARQGTSINMKILGGLTLLALLVRVFRISQPSSVVFDEVHFGGFASKYIKGEFFMDVHPPLGKLLITLAGVLSGFDGQFDFKEIGKDYVAARVPYVAMRMMPAVMGAALVPIAYMTVRRSGCSTQASVFAGLAIMLENGLATQSRHILLDSPLIFFIALSVLMWVNFRRWQHCPFTFDWWLWLAMCGGALGLAVSVKWVGLFVIGLIGVFTIKDLWDLLGELQVKPITLLHHFAARLLCLVVLPLLIYMFFFEVHFLMLPKAGDGNGFMSVEFQQTLAGVQHPSTTADVAYESKVFIRHVATNGGYLHSHAHNYQTGSKQRQITLYPHRDENSYFIIKKKIGEPMNSTQPEWVMHGDVIRLEHAVTHRHLHSHDHRPPITDNDQHNEVSGYGADNFDGDSNDYWRLEILEGDPRDPESTKRLRSIHSKFRLVHVNTNCHLFSHAVKLPDYAFGQQEVTCMKSPKKPKTLWRVVENINDQLPADAELVNYHKPGFLGKFFELNKVMWNTNKGLTDSHPFDSKPISWPFLLRGISFSTSNQKQVYLLGNPFVWWTATASVIAIALIEVGLAVMNQRGYMVYTGVRAKYEPITIFFFAGWLLHYVPFFLMGRQLFLHHYFPALYFAVLSSACVFDLAARRLRPTARWAAVAALCALFTYAFVRFSFVTYGLPATRAACERARWLASWDFGCSAFPTELASAGGPAVSAASPS